jgi:hypothetical protein
MIEMKSFEEKSRTRRLGTENQPSPWAYNAFPEAGWYPGYPRKMMVGKEDQKALARVILRTGGWGH